MRILFAVIILLALLCSSVYAGEKEVLTGQLAYRNLEINRVLADIEPLEKLYQSYQEQLQRARNAKARIEERLKQIEAEEAGDVVGP